VSFKALASIGFPRSAVLPPQFAKRASTPLYPDRRKDAQGKKRRVSATKRSKEVAN
jgi:hypothetical protein